MSSTKIDISNLADSVIAALSVPKINTIDYPGDDTAADPAGNQLITLNGSGFNIGAQVFVDGTIASIVSVLSSTQLTFISPAKAPGSYELRVVNTDGGLATSVNNIQYSGVPVWTTPSGSLANVYEGGSFTSTLLATSDTPVSYSLTTGALPTGVTLTGNTISGTPGTVLGDTTYNFTIDAIDAELQNTSRNFNIGVLSDTVTWNSPANNSTTTANNVSNITPVILNATTAAGSSVVYSANTLPLGLSLAGNTISGTALNVANTSSLVTATSTQSGKSANITLNFNITSATVAPGQIEFVTPGSYSWTVPAGVTSISAVCVGGGGGGNYGTFTNGSPGNGGDLRYITVFSVNPGEVFDIIVGAGGAKANSAPGQSGGYSSIVRTSDNSIVLVAAGGGIARGAANGTSTTTSAVVGGGNGGLAGPSGGSSGAPGAGGAGGYSGNGGAGAQGYTSNAGSPGTGGGGGGGGASMAMGTGGWGGGVGIYGQGNNGSGGSGGMNGSPGSGGSGQVYGGGGATVDQNLPANATSGGKGAVRIIWGTGRAYPSTNTQNM